jgi:hypothetical protein
MVEPGKYTTRLAEPNERGSRMPRVKSAHNGITRRRGYARASRDAAQCKCAPEISTGMYASSAGSASTNNRVFRLLPLPSSISVARGPIAAAIP